MAFLENLGPALRLLRERRSFTQAQVERDAALGASSVSRYERSVERPALATLDAMLRAMGCDLRDLVLALDEVDGRASSSLSGRANARWVAMLSGRPLGEELLNGFASAVLDADDAQAREDFVATVETVAAELARRVITALDTPHLAVAERASSYEAKPARKPRA